MSPRRDRLLDAQPPRAGIAQLRAVQGDPVHRGAGELRHVNGGKDFLGESAARSPTQRETDGSQSRHFRVYPPLGFPELDHFMKEP